MTPTRCPAPLRARSAVRAPGPGSVAGGSLGQGREDQPPRGRASAGGQSGRGAPQVEGGLRQEPHARAPAPCYGQGGRAQCARGGAVPGRDKHVGGTGSRGPWWDQGARCEQGGSTTPRLLAGGRPSWGCRFPRGTPGRSGTGVARGFLVLTPGLGRAVACVWREHGSCRGSERTLRSSPRGSHAVILRLLRGSQRPGPEAVLPRGTSSGRRAGAAAPGGPARQGHMPPAAILTRHGADGEGSPGFDKGPETVVVGLQCRHTPALDEAEPAPETRGRLKPGSRRQRYPSRLRVYKVAAGAMKGQSSGLKNTVAAHIRRYSSTALENEGGGDF